MLQKSTIVFFTNPRPDSLGCYYTHPDLGLRQAQETAAFSVLSSLAEFLVWKFPNLPSPGKQQVVIRETPRTSSAPYYFSILHSMFPHWCYLMSEAVELGNAIKSGDTCYYRVEVSDEYGALLEQQGFKRKEFYGDFGWEFISLELLQLQRKLNEKQRDIILFVNCSDLQFRHTFYGEYFDNQVWKEYKILYGKSPTQEEYAKAKVVLVPGSKLHIGEPAPQLLKFTNQLTIALEKNKKLKWLGICFGAQLIAHTYGGRVANSGKHHSGVEEVLISKDKYLVARSHPWAKQLFTHSNVYLVQDHRDQIVVMPPNFQTLLTSKQIEKQMIASKCGRILAIQGHPQSSALRSALNKINKEYTLSNDLQEATKSIENLLIPLVDSPNLLRRMLIKFLSC